MKENIVIIGAGLSGLSCAMELQAYDIPFILLEANEHVGGRVWSDDVDGFLLDRGFQVLLSSYRESRRLLDFSKLDLQHFPSGAHIWDGKQLRSVFNPLRHPLSTLETFRSGLLSHSDVVTLGKLALSSRGQDVANGNQSTSSFLKSLNLSEDARRNFLTPFFRGVFLEQDLRIDSSFFRYLFARFAFGTACVPRLGMRAIPLQLAGQIPAEQIKLGTRVEAIEGNRVQLAKGDTIEATRIVFAGDLSSFERLVEKKPETTTGFRGTRNLYFKTDRAAPSDSSALVLNASGEGAWNNMHFPSNLCANFSPVGSTLISVSCTSGVSNEAPYTLAEHLKSDLEKVWGSSVRSWELLSVYDIPEALPPLPAKNGHCKRGNIFIAGDHTTHSSIEGALISGIRAAHTLLTS